MRLITNRVVKDVKKLCGQAFYFLFSPGWLYLKAWVTIYWRWNSKLLDVSTQCERQALERTETQCSSCNQYYIQSHIKTNKTEAECWVSRWFVSNSAAEKGFQTDILTAYMVENRLHPWRCESFSPAVLLWRQLRSNRYFSLYYYWALAQLIMHGCFFTLNTEALQFSAANA